MLDELGEGGDQEDNLSISSFVSTPSCRMLNSYSSSSNVTPTSSSYSSSSNANVSRKRPYSTDSHGSPGDMGSVFKLPVFFPDTRQCIRKDAFYTSAQRNKLIKEACMGLRGFCWEKEKDVINEEKRNLAISLLELAPKSLGDPDENCKPEVSWTSSMTIVKYYFVLYRLACMDRYFVGFITTIISIERVVVKRARRGVWSLVQH